MDPEPKWHLYLLRCGDGSLYTGITTDVERRLREHQRAAAGGRGAKALRGRQPLALAFTRAVGSRSKALRIEYRVKRLSKGDKEALVNRTSPLSTLIPEVEDDDR